MIYLDPARSISRSLRNAVTVASVGTNVTSAPVHMQPSSLFPCFLSSDNLAFRWYWTLFHSWTIFKKVSRGGICFFKWTVGWVVQKRELMRKESHYSKWNEKKQSETHLWVFPFWILSLRFCFHFIRRLNLAILGCPWKTCWWFWWRQNSVER